MNKIEFTHHYNSPIGGITLASDGEALIGLWFDGQKYFADALEGDYRYCEEKDCEEKDCEEKDREEKDCEEKDCEEKDCEEKDYEEKDLPVFRMTDRWLDIYFDGKAPDFTPPLRMKTTDFRREVWEILLTIPYGQTMSYGEIAKQIGEKRLLSSKTSARAVGGAVGHNSISLIIPCHRVIGADGSLTGYAGGLDKKIWLLKHEGILRNSEKEETCS